MIFEIFVLVFASIFSLIITIRSLLQVRESYVRKKAIDIHEFHEFSKAVTRTCGHSDWKSNFKIFHTVYKAAKKARKNKKKNKKWKTL